MHTHTSTFTTLFDTEMMAGFVEIGHNETTIFTTKGFTTKGFA
jgi:hypothetical protein